MSADTHFRVYASNNIADVEPETLDGTGFSETCKASLKENIEIANKTFVGSPSEDDIDVVRGGPYYLGPNDHSRSRAQQNITSKAGAYSILRGDFGRAVIGQYSIYDRWLRGPKSRIDFSDDAGGTVELWWAEYPKYVPPFVRVVTVPRWKVYAYFLFRSVVQTLTGK